MKLRKILLIFFSLVLSLQSIAAFETDQYNLPPAPLADISGEVSEYVEQNLSEALEKINREISQRQSCLEKKTAKNCGSPEKEKARLQFLRSNDAVALAVFKLLGDGVIPFTKSGSWMESHRFLAEPARYKTDYSHSIYFTNPINYFTLSATVKIYDTEFGTDKIAHFFQQGYTYYRIAEREKSKGSTTEKAREKAVRWGQKTERTYYGTLVSGVYSNADLCANYVGMRFYENLTAEIKINGNIKPAIFVLENGLWQFNPNFNRREMLLKLFLTEHLNEALNPSIYTNLFGLRAYVRRVVRKQSCPQWAKQKTNFTQASFNDLSQSLRLWNSEDYGFTDSKNFINLGDVCFAQDRSKTDSSVKK